MSDTPETDKQSWWNHSAGKIELCPADFARKLERERDVAQKAMGDARDILLDAMPDANAPTKILAEMIVAERDKYQEQADALLIRLGATQERMINAERERDEWKEVAEGSLLGAIKERDALRNELNFTIRLSRTWEDDVKNISADRDYWKAEAERWRVTR